MKVDKRDSIVDDNKDGEVFEKVVFDLMLNKYSDDKELTEYVLSLPKEQQRMVVLSLIDDDNNLWTKMNTFVDECNDELEHIKEVIKIMFKFVKEGDVEKKQFGEVMTPLELVKEMLNTLPKDVWSNPNLKWLDPANGAGTFPLVVIYKLMKGLSEWEPNVEKRYKHIVENMIYTCELQSRNVFLWLCGVDPKDKYTTNTYWGSFLDSEFDNHMKTVWGVEKFDIVVGNPPYQELKTGNKKSQSIWDKFVENTFKYLNNDGYICYVHPSGWRDIDGMFKQTQKLMIDKEILYLSIHNEKDGMKVFGMDTRYDYYVLKNKVNTGGFITKIRCQDGTIVNNSLYKMEFIPNGMFNDIVNLVAKDVDEKVEVIADSSYHTQRDFMSKSESTLNKYPCIYTVKSGDIPTIWYSNINSNGHFGIPKLIWSNFRISSAGCIVDEDGIYGLTQFSYAIVANQEELPKIKKAFDTKKFRDMMENCSVANMSINRKIIATFKKDFWKEFI